MIFIFTVYINTIYTNYYIYKGIKVRKLSICRTSNLAETNILNL